MKFQADSIRGVAFFAPNTKQGDALSVWSALFPGESPDGFQKGNPQMNLMSTAHGIRDGLQVIINSQVSRVDINFSKAPNTFPGQGSVHQIEDLPKAINNSLFLLKRLAGIFSVIRCALVADLTAIVPRENVSSKMKDVLSKFPFPEGSTDISMQFNLPRMFEHAPNVTMNRLCAWTSGQMAIVNQAGGMGGVFSIDQLLAGAMWYVGMKVDANTQPEIDISNLDINSLLDELGAEVIALSSEGLARIMP